MDRREFTGLVAAGALFPADFVKALGSQPIRRRVPRLAGTHWYCLGTNEEPLADLWDLHNVHQCLIGKQEWNDRLDSIPRVGYQILVPPDRWVISLGNEDRPACAEDICAFSDELDCHLVSDWRELTIVTHFTHVPYEFMGCTLHNPPMIVSHQMAEGMLKRGKIRDSRGIKILPRWSNSC